jgi:hypothetical protein
MNAYYRALAQVANALVALWRWATAVVEGPGYVPPVPADHVVSLEAQAAAWAFPTPIGRVSQWSDAPKVDLSKPEPMPNLVRPYVGSLKVSLEKRLSYVGRAVVRVQVAFDELGLPSSRAMSNQDTPTLGIFEQAWTAFQLRTGKQNGSIALSGL